jgi:hypothetical protein
MNEPYGAEEARAMLRPMLIAGISICVLLVVWLHIWAPLAVWVTVTLPTYHYQLKWMKEREDSEALAKANVPAQVVEVTATFEPSDDPEWGRL